MIEEEKEENKPEPKPVNVKVNVKALVTALSVAETISKYQVLEKDYPSDLPLLPDQGRSINNPILVNYISKAESKMVEGYIKEVIDRAASMIRKDLEEIREMLG